MKDRQFMTVLGLVVAAGLVMGLIAFRMTGASPAMETASAGNSAVANPYASSPSGADEQSADAGSSSSSSTDFQGNAEPTRRDGEASDATNPEPAAPPPPPPPVASVEVAGDSPPQ